MKVVVIGAGPAGLTAAYLLAKHGVRVEVYEADSQVGGMSRSLRLWGQTVDLGPHRFYSSNKRVNELWLEVVQQDYAIVERLTRIFYNGKFFRYPLEALDVLSKLGPFEAARCVSSYLTSKVRRACPSQVNLEAWLCEKFGRRLYEIFFKAYSEKLWGVPCAELEPDFGIQRIRQFSLSAAVRSALFKGERKRHRTLADQFAYPLQGTGMVYERMAEAVTRQAGHVYLETPVRRVLVENGKAVGVELGSGVKVACDHVISTMPLPELVVGLVDSTEEVRLAVERLSFRNTILVFVEVLDKDLFPDQWIYVHSPGLRCGRVTNFRNWVPQLYGDTESTILAVEYWCSPGDAIWQSEEEWLIDLAKRELLALGIIKNPGRFRRGKAFRVPNCYPVYRLGYRQYLQKVEKFLGGISGLTVIGRAGAFKYGNQDHSMWMGIVAADHILSGRSWNVWAADVDSAEYLEAASFESTGLLNEKLVPSEN